MSFVRCGVAVLAAALAACSAKPNSPSQLPNGSMSARIDGGTWSPATIGAGITDGLLTINGADGQGQTIRAIQMGILGASVGTFTTTTGPNGLGAVFILTITSGTSATAFGAGGSTGSGSITITSLTSTGVSGTFFFTAVADPRTGASGTRQVTEGQFNITF